VGGQQGLPGGASGGCPLTASRHAAGPSGRSNGNAGTAIYRHFGGSA
jgi:hypothetical protein